MWLFVSFKESVDSLDKLELEMFVLMFGGNLS